MTTSLRQSVRRRLGRATKPARSRAFVALERLEPPARLLLRGWPRDLPPFGVVLVYRARNASNVRQLVEGVPPGTKVGLWALDEVAPELASLTVGSGPGARMDLLDRLAQVLALPDDGWLAVCDDDVLLQRGSLADLVRIAASLGFDVSQPAHSHASTHFWKFNEHRFLTLARATRFVETGPLLVFSPRGRAACLPVPKAFRMGIGSEAVWGSQPELRLGVIDLMTMVHTGVIGTAYDGGAEWAATTQVVEELLRPLGLRTLDDLQRSVGRWWWWQRRPAWAQPVETSA